MIADDLRRRGESFNQELGRESYQAGAGLKAETDFAGLFARYADLASDEAWAAARGNRALTEWVADNRVGRAVAGLDDRLHAWEASALVVLPDGERMAYQRVGIAIANERVRERRRALDSARRAVLAEPTAIRKERLALERELLRAVSADYVEARSRLSGVDLESLAEQCGFLLDSTRDVYRSVLAERLKNDLGVSLADAERSDGAYLFRIAAYDDAFRAADLVPIARRQVSEMGLDLEAGGRVRLDTEERERKRARAFCAPVRVPDEVYLVTRPHGGYTDYRAFWHELGHALHFANAAGALPFEHRWLGDNSVTEAYAMLFEHQTMQATWLRRYAGLSGERLGRFLRGQAFALLAIVRRYAAKLRYEIHLHRSPTLEAGAEVYAEMLSSATGLRYPDEDALLDLDDGFYAARYLRAWQLEAALRRRLVESFDEDWFRNPRSGPLVLDLLSRGQRDDAATLATQVTGAALSFAALVPELERHLQ